MIRKGFGVCWSMVLEYGVCVGCAVSGWLCSGYWRSSNKSGTSFVVFMAVEFLVMKEEEMIRSRVCYWAEKLDKEMFAWCSLLKRGKRVN